MQVEVIPEMQVAGDATAILFFLDGDTSLRRLCDHPADLVYAVAGLRREIDRAAADPPPAPLADLVAAWGDGASPDLERMQIAEPFARYYGRACVIGILLEPWPDIPDVAARMAPRAAAWLAARYPSASLAGVEVVHIKTHISRDIRSAARWSRPC